MVLSTPRHVVLLAVSLLVSAVAVGCSDDGSAGKDGASDGGAADAEVGASDAGPLRPLDELIGGFTIAFKPAREAILTLPANKAHTSILGKVKVGPEPDPQGLIETASEGDCRLLEPNQPFCAQSCTSGSVCVQSGSCEPAAVPTSIGAVTVSGLGAATIDLGLVNNSYQCADCGTALAYPPCVEGESIVLEAEGGQYPAFTLEASCIAPLEVAGDITVESGKPVPLTWSKPTDGTQARIDVMLDISSHGGGSKGRIVCDTEDDGELEIAEPLVTQLVALGFAGAPSVSVKRKVLGRSRQAQPADVVLEVSSDVTQIVNIPGLVSCTEDTQCPDGQTCQLDAQCK